MAIPDPIRLLEGLSRPAIFLALIALFLLLGALMQRSMAPANDAAKAAHPEHKSKGILALELAPDETTATGVLRDWGARGRTLAAFSVGLDALFIVIYVGLLALGCRMAADGFAGLGWTLTATAGAMLAWAAVVAGALDAVENLGLIRMFDGETGTGWPRITSLCAKAKFFLSGVAAIYVLTAIALLRAKFFT